MPVTHAYVGIKKCGCVVTASCDTESDKALVAKDLQGYILSGLRIERVPIDEARKRLKRCNCKEVSDADNAEAITD